LDEAIDAVLMMSTNEKRTRMKRLKRAVDTLEVATGGRLRLTALERSGR
jgi:trehalose-6-phosphate synthase